jgi:hypothetical protein
MTKKEIADDIRAKFPGVKVHFYEGLFNYGLGVDLNGKRNACILHDDMPENWRAAADKLIEWLARVD